VNAAGPLPSACGPWQIAQFAWNSWRPASMFSGVSGTGFDWNRAVNGTGGVGMSMAKNEPT
jgi:hypothetical protein